MKIDSSAIPLYLLNVTQYSFPEVYLEFLKMVIKSLAIEFDWSRSEQICKFLVRPDNRTGLIQTGDFFLAGRISDLI